VLDLGIRAGTHSRTLGIGDVVNALEAVRADLPCPLPIACQRRDKDVYTSNDTESSSEDTAGEDTL
jgi:hypothetical protein